MTKKAVVRTARLMREHMRPLRVVCAIRGVTHEAYMAGVLADCATAVEAEVARVGYVAVRDDRLRLAQSAGPYTTVAIDPDLNDRLTSLAGQCLTSVSRLVEPYLRPRLAADHRAAVADECMRLGLAVNPEVAK